MGSIEHGSGHSEFGSQQPFIPPWSNMNAPPAGSGGGEITPPGDGPESGSLPLRPEARQPAEPEIKPPGGPLSPLENTPQESQAPLSRGLARRLQDITVRGARQSYERESAERREAFLGEVGHLHDERGVDMRTAEAFMGALGLTSTVRTLIVRDEHYNEVITVAERLGAPIPTASRSGVYKPALGTIIIPRGAETTGAQIATTVVHEKGGHGTTPWMAEPAARAVKEFERRHGLPPVPIMGLRDFDPETGAITGDFLDEGRAEWIALEHRRATGDYDPDLVGSIDGVKYGGTRSMYNPAATAFDLLFAKDEGLIEPVLKLGRDLGAAEETVYRINRIHPGLYSALSSVPYTGGTGAQETADIRAFNKGLQIVMEATGFTDADIRPIVNDGPGTRFVAERLQRQAAAEGRPSSWYPHDR